MDYLRQQIEASLGRSEELLISDKARRNFYRYPVEYPLFPPPVPPPPPLTKKSSKERSGTFNSVRLMKYLGIGNSKRKSKLDSDDLQQKLQQQAYLEELRRYRPLASVPPPPPPYYDGHGPIAMHYHPHHQAACYREPWPGEGGTVRARNVGHYPSVCASVGPRRARSRGSLQNVIYAWDQPYLQSPSVAALADLPPRTLHQGPDVFECPCSCEEHLMKGKKHRSQCTCTSGAKSTRRSKPAPRAPLFAAGKPGGAVELYRRLDDQDSAIRDTTADRNATVVNAKKTAPLPPPPPLPSRVSRSNSNVTKSRLHRLSDVSTMTSDYQHSVSPQSFNDSAPKRRSILECSVNPYDLMKQQSDYKRRSSLGKVQRRMTDDFDDGLSDILETISNADIKSGMTQSQTGINGTSIGPQCTADGSADAEEGRGDISLGGQRIRLFDTVKGTVSGKNGVSCKRPSIPKFARLPPAPPSPPVPRRRNFPGYADGQGGQRQTKGNDALARSLQVIATSKSSDSDNEWEENTNRVQSVPNNALVMVALTEVTATEVAEVQEQEHKTTITISGSGAASGKQSNETTNSSTWPPGGSTGPPESRDYGSPKGSGSTLESTDDSQNRMTVISIEQGAETAGGATSVGSNRLHLKINFNELPAYLKPILKKVAFNESSASSEADSSDTYGSTLVDFRQKQKKHVHFLSNRSSTNSDDSFKDSPSTESPVSEVSGSMQTLNVFQSVPQGTSESEKPLDGDADSKSCTSESENGTDHSVLEDLYDDGTSLSTKPTDGETVKPQYTDADNSTQRLSTGENHSPDSEKTPVQESATSLLAEETSASPDFTEDPVQPLFKKAPTPPRRRNRTPAARELRRTTLRRSQSERQVSTTEDHGKGDPKYHRNVHHVPVRSNSFQILVPGKNHSAMTPLPDTGDKKRTSELPQPPCNKLSTFCSPNNLNAPPSGGDAPHKKYICKEIDHQPLYQNSFKDVDIVSNANRVETSTNQSKSQRPPRCTWSSSSNVGVDANATTPTTSATTTTTPPNSWDRMMVNRDVSGRNCNNYHHRRHHNNNGGLRDAEIERPVAPLDIAKLRSIPKFLPRPTLGSKHVCGLQYRDEPSSGHRTTAGTAREVQWSSDEELYTDGCSSTTASSVTGNVDHANAKPLPPIPYEIAEERSTSSPEYPSDDNAIYEQIAEPLYEEVPDTVSHTSVTSATSGSLGHPRKSIFEGASRTEILNYLEDAKERGVENIETSEDAELLVEEDEPQDDIESQNISTKRHHRNRISNVSDLSDSSHTSEESFQNDEAKDIKDRNYPSAEVERNDSGVGSETSKPSRLRRQSRLGSNEQVCVDCDQTLDPIWDAEGGAHLDPLVCRKCSKKRNERKEIILEFVETEIKYGRDLRIIKEEFHRPMLVAGLLSEELLNNIFLNLDELIDVNVKFSEKLKDALDIALEQGDEDYSTVNVGKVFLESSAMLHAFEAYCVRQGTASLLLTNLEKDKELLRIFLKVSQMENTLLRRLNLNSFLMVPVQRVTKYPLLLNRLYKVTPHHHQDREALREAQMKIEMHLEHINQQAKDLSGMNIWRRISNISNSQRRNLLEPVIGNIKLRKMALEILQWNNEEVRFVMEGRLQYALLTENLWNKREKSFKLTPVHGLLVTLGNPNSNYRPDLADRDFIFPRSTGIREATLVIIKEKNSRFNLLRDPLPLQKCVISAESDESEIFEIQEFTTKDAYLIKADDPKDTQEWLKMLRYHAKDLGAWRRRRNALANIMINGMVARREWL